MPLSFFFDATIHHRALHSFPTRRSSDLRCRLWRPRASLELPACLVGTERQGDHFQPDGRDLAARHRRNRHREPAARSEEHTSELQSHVNLVCRLLLEKKKKKKLASGIDG